MAENESPQAVVNASRDEDPSCLPADVEKVVQRRLNMTLGGLVVAFSGSAIAILGAVKPQVDLKLVVIGILAALVGAGSVDPNLVFNYFRGNGGK